jgi:8-oxo-dGTP pyrophosphatase MutT (NUDIX family)
VLVEEPSPLHPPSKVPWPDAIPAGKKVAYGGVVFDHQGRVLLREPRDHFDGYVWTFPKGRPQEAESPDVTAEREVFEESGVSARILAPIPGEFLGGTSINRYFLMMPRGKAVDLGPEDDETVATCWADLERAKVMIGQTTNKVGRKRDLAVLEAACKTRKWVIENQPFLGDREVVTGLVETFTKTIIDVQMDFHHGKIDRATCLDRMHELCMEYGRIVMGEDARYRPAPWNGLRLGTKIRTTIKATKPFSHEGDFLFRWLAGTTVRALDEMADGSPDEETGPRLQEYMVKVVNLLIEVV